MWLDITSPNRTTKKYLSGPTTRMLNVGCGEQFHSDWTNIDLTPVNKGIVTCDLTNGLPFDDGSFDVVYHSHVLEHLNASDGVAFLKECFRVLRRGGLLRIVVPDLEQIAALYLEMHDRAWDGEVEAESDYAWMKLELLDQLVRERSGGRMGEYMADPKIRNSTFVRSRVGGEYSRCLQSSFWHPANLRNPSRAKIRLRACKEWLARKFIWLLLGRVAENAFSEGLFRCSGEVHRWMYDRFSLRDLCCRVGFSDFEIMTAETSCIPGFNDFELDIVGPEIRKPDSLFIECFKP